MNARLEKFLDKYEDFPKPLRKNKYLFIFCMLIISIISFAIFYVGINTQSILMAFQQLVGYTEEGEEIYRWTFDNFTRFFQELGDANYAGGLLEAFKNTLFLYFFGNLWAVPMGCIVSYYLWKKMPGHTAFRTIFYLPGIISSVVITILFKNLISPNGFVGSIYMNITGEVLPPFLAQDSTAIWMILIYNIWVGFAGSYILQFAALCRIPEEIVESAKLDGANAWVEYIHICIPLSWPTLYILLIQKITGILSADGPVLLLTNGSYGTTTIGYWNYKNVILTATYEYPAAVGLMMTIIVVPITLGARNLLSRVYRDVEF